MNQLTVVKNKVELSDNWFMTCRMQVVKAEVMVENAKDTLDAAILIGSPVLVTLCKKLLVEARTTAERWTEVRNEFQESAIHWASQLEICRDAKNASRCPET